jgi:hypothetical protein
VTWATALRRETSKWVPSRGLDGPMQQLNRVSDGSRQGVYRWTTALNVKLLLPPRQSRGASLGRLALAAGRAAVAHLRNTLKRRTYTHIGGLRRKKRPVAMGGPARKGVVQNR